MKPKLTFTDGTGISLRYGIAIGLLFCLYTILMWITKLDAGYYYIGQYFDIAIILLPIILLFGAIRFAVKRYRLTFLQRLLLTMGVSFVYFIIYSPFLYVYHNYINPDWFSHVLSHYEKKYAAANLSSSVIAEKLESMKSINTKRNTVFSGFLTLIIVVPLIISLLSLIFIRSKKEKEQNNYHLS